MVEALTSRNSIRAAGRLEQSISAVRNSIRAAGRLEQSISAVILTLGDSAGRKLGFNSFSSQRLTTYRLLEL
jgi:hypothetical protein